MRWGDSAGRTLAWIAVAVACVLVLGVGAVGAACKLALDCGREGAVTVENAARPSEGSTVLPAGFDEELIAGELNFPTSFDLLPDGRILVAERDGAIRLVDNGVVAADPALDLRGRVSVAQFRGVVALTVDSLFSENGFVYLLYSPSAKGGPSDDGPTTVRLSRFTMRGDVIDAGSETVILGAATPPTGSCTDLPATADCLPSDIDHIGGDIVFAPDGTLFVSTGDGGGADAEVEPTAQRSQDPDALGGKVLHITREGAGLATNPFYGGATGANRAKVWAVGLRNPFRLVLTPGSGLPIVGDVGANEVEELDAAPRGVNLGWPCYAADRKAAVYSATPACQSLYSSSRPVVGPVYSYPHDGTVSITGGAFVREDAYPAPLGGAYVFADWATGVIWVARLDPVTGALTGKPQVFATAAGGPVQFRPDTNGALYYLALNNGELRRIVSR